MADSTNGQTNGQPEGSAHPAPQAIKVQIVGQYIKDLSFENPSIGKLLEGPGETPNLTLDIDVNARRVEPELYESGIAFKAQATNKAGTIYDLELTYVGLFRIKSIPEPALEPFLLINCPTIIFPFLRRLVADITREGGFPPLLLDPVDFGVLFMRRQQEHASAAKPSS